MSTVVEQPDYADCFSVTAPGATGRTPEAWARIAIEGASPFGRFLTWRVLCGLRLDPRPSPENLAGWRIAERGGNTIALAARSWFMSARIVVQVDEDRLSLATFVRYDHPVARLVWPAVAPIHRRAVPSLLRAAVRSRRPLSAR